MDVFSAVGDLVALIALAVSIWTVVTGRRRDAESLELARRADERAQAAELGAASADERAERAESRAVNAERFTAIRFQIEPNGPGMYNLLIRNVGTLRAEGVTMSPRSIGMHFSLTSALENAIIPAGDSVTFGCHRADIVGDSGELPDTIRVTWTAPFPGEQNVAFPRAKAMSEPAQ